MSVQSRREPSKLFAIGILFGLFWVLLLGVICCFVKGTFQEIQNQALEGTARGYKVLYSSSLVIPAVGALCRVRRIDGSKGLYLTLQLFFLIFLVGIFRIVLPVINGSGRAFFLGNPEPGAISTYEVFFIWMLCTFGVLLLMLSVMNDKYRNDIRIAVGGILFVISILLPKALDSYVLLRATCTSPVLQDPFVEELCQAVAIETIPMFTMAIAFAATLTLLFFVAMLSPTVERLISSPTSDDNETQQNPLGQELETAALPSSADPPPPVVKRHSPCGSFAAAILGGAIVWMIQAIREQTTKHR